MNIRSRVTKYFGNADEFLFDQFFEDALGQYQRAFEEVLRDIKLLPKPNPTLQTYYARAQFGMVKCRVALGRIGFDKAVLELNEVSSTCQDHEYSEFPALEDLLKQVSAYREEMQQPAMKANHYYNHGLSLFEEQEKEDTRDGVRKIKLEQALNNLKQAKALYAQHKPEDVTDTTEQLSRVYEALADYYFDQGKNTENKEDKVANYKQADKYYVAAMNENNVSKTLDVYLSRLNVAQKLAKLLPDKKAVYVKHMQEYIDSRKIAELIENMADKEEQADKRAILQKHLHYISANSPPPALAPVRRQAQKRRAEDSASSTAIPAAPMLTPAASSSTTAAAMPLVSTQKERRSSVSFTPDSFFAGDPKPVLKRSKRSPRDVHDQAQVPQAVDLVFVSEINRQNIRLRFHAAIDEYIKAISLSPQAELHVSSMFRSLGRFHRKNIAGLDKPQQYAAITRTCYEYAIYLGNRLAENELNSIKGDHAMRFISGGDHFRQENEGKAIFIQKKNSNGILPLLRAQMEDYVAELESLYPAEMPAVITRLLEYIGHEIDKGEYLRQTLRGPIVKQDADHTRIFMQAAAELGNAKGKDWLVSNGLITVSDRHQSPALSRPAQI